MTHNLTHNRKRAGGGNGTESTIAPDFLEQKCPQSAGWRRFEGGVSVGKDEVSSSNLDSSSTETRCPARDSGFLLCSCVEVRQHKTHTETHTDKRRGLAGGHS